MLVLEVAQLVSENRFDFARCELVEQGVEEDNALGAAEAGEIRVAVG